MFSASKDRLPADKSFRIKQDDKFFSRLLSKEASMANSSGRVLYYGGASGAVPFMWESQPGTPKHTLSEISMPPLTPPPSYHTNSKLVTCKGKKSRGAMLVFNIFPRFASPKKAHHVSPSPSLSSESSLSSWSWSSYSSPSYSLSSKDELEGHGLSLSKSPTSTLGFYLRHEGSDGIRGCCPIGNMKSAISVLVGHRRLGHNTEITSHDVNLPLT